MAYKVLDLFSGAGGLSRGFYDAGYDVVLGVDFDEAALKTFKENHGKAEAMKLDLFDHSNIDVIINFLEEKDIKLDVLVGGPPCQGFSVAGPRDMNDKRNTLYTAMVKLAEQVKPQAVVLENVPGMVQTNGGIGAKRVVEDFAKIGYRMVPKLLYAPDYGIPQMRKRVFFVGLRDSHEDFKFPEPTVGKNDYVTCEEAIGDLPSLQTDEGDIIYGEEIQDYLYPIQNDYQKRMRANSEKVRNHIGSIPIEFCDMKNGQLQSTAESMRLSILGRDAKAKDDKPLGVVDAYMKENTTELVDPLDVKKKADMLEEKRNILLTELDTQIKVSNATTFIEIA